MWLNVAVFVALILSVLHVIVLYIVKSFQFLTQLNVDKAFLF